MSKGQAGKPPVVATEESAFPVPICMEPMGEQLLRHLAKLQLEDIEQEAIRLALLLLEAREQAKLLVELRQQSSGLIEGMGGSKLANFHEEP
jgi:hypothetical protein